MTAFSGDEMVAIARSVSSRDEFIEFMKLIINNLKYHKNEWDNQSLDLFLQGMSRFANDMDGYYQRFNNTIDPNVASWRVFAEMILASRVYE